MITRGNGKFYNYEMKDFENERSEVAFLCNKRVFIFPHFHIKILEIHRLKDTKDGE